MRNPVIAIRNANTLLEMNDGYMVSIGGLLREEEIKTERRIPILGSIPLLGTFFRASNSEKIRSQLVIFLSVKVVNPDEMSADTIDAKGVSKELQTQIDATRTAIPQKKSTFFGGFKKLFQ
jgi:type II secretory pathway component GspD/PulD (secretin)